MDAAWSADERPVVGIVDPNVEAGPSDGAESLEDALRPTLDAHDATAVGGDAADVLAGSPSVLVVAGEDALSAVARRRPDVPVLPVGDVTGIDAVDLDRLPAALEAVLEGDARIHRHPILGLEVEDRGDAAGRGSTGDAADSVERDGAREYALFDATLVTDEPARISEYGVSSRGESVATFRADGVVIATPAGSHGYASAVDAPHLSAAVDAVAVAPIAPFVTQTRRWVLPDDDLAVTVERDEGDVRLVADGRSVATVDVDSRVTIAVDGALETLSVPDGVLES
ncbi:NAD(+)/NADH kinase [Haloterrigena alkaliphila]|uniref:NAD(+)/NADH kinase n=1 Tax=Haloterrigena alkaliphila TaxID=2816475 RepID=A0A8A2VC81_9EURY|nr:NAD(+)/NADH kinase [Haloterrigena alkaliphila]QSW98330.1 NAD(+)/NADH kinase [Haloterrigena alkaliphila]